MCNEKYKKKKRQKSLLKKSNLLAMNNGAIAEKSKWINIWYEIIYFQHLQLKIFVAPHPVSLNDLRC